MCGGFIGEGLGLKKRMPEVAATDPAGDARRAEAQAAIRANKERVARSDRRRQQSLLGSFGGGEQSALTQYGKSTLG